MADPILKAENDQLRIEIGMLRRRSEEQIVRLQEDLRKVRTERDDLQRRLDALASTERQHKGVHQKEDELIAELEVARETISDLHARVQTLTQFNAKVQVERADLQARVEAMERGLSEEPIRTDDSQQRIAQLEAELADLRSEHEMAEAAVIELDEFRQEHALFARKVEELQRELDAVKASTAAAEATHGGKKKHRG